MKIKLIFSLILFLSQAVASAQTAFFRAYEVRFGKADGRGTSERTDIERAIIEKARLKIAGALKDRVLETAHLRYTNEGDLFICIESATYGMGAAARNAEKTKKIYEELLKLKPEIANEIKTCINQEPTFKRNI